LTVSQAAADRQETLAGVPTPSVTQAAAGRIDSEEFHRLYLRLRPDLESQARRFVKRSQEIEDIVQETLLRVYVSAVDLESDLHALAFARRVLSNICIDRFRAAGRRPAVVSLEGSLAYQLPDDEDETQETVLRAEDASVVRDAMAQLSPEHRAALIKRDIEEKPVPVIAAELGIPAESVKHLVFRARRSLRKRLVGTMVEPGIDPELAHSHAEPSH
jgi:RNA polymerase sigma-70 factor (ECF subfamily)